LYSSGFGELGFLLDWGMADPTAQLPSEAITVIEIEGFKSIRDRIRIEFRPLTVIAGANSSGKSSAMQPLLLIKQTIESSVKQKVFALNGSILKFTSSRQLFWKFGEMASFALKVDLGGESIEVVYGFSGEGLEVLSTKLETKRFELLFDKVHNNSELVNFTFSYEEKPPQLHTDMNLIGNGWYLFANVGVFTAKYIRSNGSNNIKKYQEAISQIIYLPGLRGNPESSYRFTEETERFFGVFPPYVAGILLDWQRHAPTKLEQLTSYLAQLGLTQRISIRKLNDIEAEISVGRLPNTTSDHDLINITNVGIGVSQVLPLLVALLVAKPGQMVYIEQPEIHLHPKAQVALAQALADAANRGVVVVIETHSMLILRGIQERVASGNLAPEKTMLHWFTRNDEGVTQVRSTALDATGAYGEWPEDFADIQSDIDMRYVEAAFEAMEPTKP
jgi:AAA15 family ATPase/GTPase